MVEDTNLGRTETGQDNHTDAKMHEVIKNATSRGLSGNDDKNRDGCDTRGEYRNGIRHASFDCLHSLVVKVAGMHVEFRRWRLIVASKQRVESSLVNIITLDVGR